MKVQVTGGQDQDSEDRSDFIQRDSLSFLPAYEAPLNEDERKVADIWADHLKMDRVGRNDDFFELGGDSFGAVAIAVALENAFGTTFRSASFIEFATVARQAEHLASKSSSKPAASALAGVQIGGKNPPLFYVHGGMGTTFLTREFLELLGPEQPVYFFKLPGLDGKEKPMEKIEDIAARYIEQMRQVQPKGPYYISANCSCGAIGLEMAIQLQKMGESVARLLLVDPVAAPRPFVALNIGAGPVGGGPNPDADWDKSVANFVAGHRMAARYTRRLREKDAALDDGQGFSEVSDGAIETALTVLIKALTAYCPKGKFDGRIDIVISDERFPTVHTWKSTCREYVLHRVPGSHPGIFAEKLPLMVGAMRSGLGY